MTIPEVHFKHRYTARDGTRFYKPIYVEPLQLSLPLLRLGVWPKPYSDQTYAEGANPQLAPEAANDRGKR